MKLTQEVFDEFKVLYEKEYGIKLTDQEAQELGTRLIRLVEVVYRPIPEKKK